MGIAGFFRWMTVPVDEGHDMEREATPDYNNHK